MADGDRALCDLLGFTRATVLRALESPCNTTTLAGRAGTSVPAAGQHASVLRRAGLIVTDRRDGAAVHTLTTVGAALLHAQAGRPALG
jgi:DNA-binding transcriptional ArsR family regulator